MAEAGWKTELGADGEKKTAFYLEKRGYHIIGRNYRCRYGEIDLIALDPTGEILCFVEVKTRSDFSRGQPCEAVTRSKLHRIQKAALDFLLHHPVHYRALRIDVAELILSGGRFYIRYRENAAGN